MAYSTSYRRRRKYETETRVIEGNRTCLHVYDASYAIGRAI